MKMKSKIETLLKLFSNSKFRKECFLNWGLFNWMKDEEYIKLKYSLSFDKSLDLDNPSTYTEKLQWLKLYDQRAQYTKMVDKYEVKKLVSDQIGDKYIIPTIGVWDNFDEINFDKLPQKFVIKCTHDSGSIIICKDKDAFDKKKAKRKIEKSLKRNYYSISKEWPYKNVKPRIIIEPYIEDKKDRELRDYKFFTFNGVPKVLYITKGRSADEETTADFFDMEFNHLPFTIDHNMSKECPHKPKNFYLMKELAAKLSEGIPHLRVDFYEVDGNIYFGEMTFFHCSGFMGFNPSSWDEIFGEWITLPEKRVEGNKLE